MPVIPSRTSALSLALALAAALAAPAAARAHGVAGQVERRGDRWAVRATGHGGAPLAGAAYQVFRPGAPDPVREGTTGPDGWVELAPDAPGTWRVKIADRTGHGKVIEVEVREVAAVAATGTPTTTTTTTGTGTGTGTTTGTTTATATPTATPTATGTSPPDGASPLRVAAGTAAILVLFAAVGALAALRRRRVAGR